MKSNRPRRQSSRPIWVEPPNPLVQLIKGIALVVSVLLVLVPFWSIAITSVSDQATINASGGMVLWPKGFTIEAYRAILSGGVVTQALGVSIIVTVAGTLTALVLTTCTAYWLSRPGAPMVHTGLLLILGATLFSPGMIPAYLIVKQVGLLDSLLALIIPSAIGAFNVIVMRAFFQNIPSSLYESAAIDGASSLTILLKIVLPLSKPVLAVIGLFYAVGFWNAFFNALLYIQSADKWPMALVLRTFVVNQTSMRSDEIGMSAEQIPPQLSLQMAVLMVAIVPILLVYPFLQRHFVKGVMIGAVKG